MAADIRGGWLRGPLGAGRVQFWLPPCGVFHGSLCLTHSHLLPWHWHACCCWLVCALCVVWLSLPDKWSHLVVTLACMLLTASVHHVSEPLATSRAGGMCTRAALRVLAAERASRQALRSATASESSTTMLTRRWRWRCQRIGAFLTADTPKQCGAA